MYRADKAGIEAALVEVRVFLEESESGSISVAFGEMKEDEFKELPDFDGY